MGIFRATGRLFKNAIGNGNGYGGCMCCGDRWNWKKYHEVQYTETSAMFPCCEECWQKMDREHRIHWCNRLIDRWETTTPKTGPHGKSEEYFIELRKQAEAAVDAEYEKIESDSAQLESDKTYLESDFPV